MTTNVNVEVNGSTWVNLHAAVGAVPGDSLKSIQDMMPDDRAAILVNATTAPLEDFLNVEGGIYTNRYEIYTSSPDLGEVTWARRFTGVTGVLRVQV